MCEVYGHRMTDVIVEKGVARVFASAVDWPGWCRGGRSEDEALAALIGYAPRYERIFRRDGFTARKEAAALRVVERVKGNANTERGWPGVTGKVDLRTMTEADVERLGALFRSGWRAFDSAVAKAKGRTLAKGPRGGGRTLDRIVRHVREGQLMYLEVLGAPYRDKTGGVRAEREAVLAGLASSAHGELPTKGPRGGVRWKPRYFARRSMWHTLDHLWEIEDRSS